MRAQIDGKRRRTLLRLACAASFILLFVAALAMHGIDLHAQTTQLEVRGVVVEDTSQQPIPAAEVILSEFRDVDGTLRPVMVGTVRTDARGEFSFHPATPGNYFLEARKEGYNDPGLRDGLGNPGAETPVQLSSAVRLFTTRFRLIQPGQLDGTVIDEEEQPFANLELKIMTYPAPATGAGPGLIVKTDKDGHFDAQDLAPGSYLILSQPPQGELYMPLKEPDPNVIDENIETAYWPGGNSDPALALPLRVEPGSHASAGTLRIHRKFKYPRVTVEMSGNCGAGAMSYFVTPQMEGIVAGAWKCDQPQMLRYLAPGNHYIGAFSDSTWGLTQVVVGDRPMKGVIPLQPTVDIQGSVVSADGSRPQTRPSGLTLSVRPIVGRSRQPAAATSDGAGRFTLKKVMWPEHFLSVTPMNGAAIAEIRYGGVTLRGPRLTLQEGAALEVRLDDQPGSLSGTVKRPETRPTVFLARWPMTDPLPRIEAAAPFFYFVAADAQGRYRIPGLAQGDYQAVAVSQLEVSKLTPEDLMRRLGSGERVTLNRGENKVLELNP